MFFKKLFAISLASAIFSSNFSNISLANQRNDVSIYAEPQMRVEKGLDNDEAKSTKSFKFSGPKAKLDLFQGDNLDIALGQGLRFILDDTQSNYVDDKKSLNEFILKNPLVVECILSTERYLNENEDSQTDRQVELLRRLYSLKILIYYLNYYIINLSKGGLLNLKTPVKCSPTQKRFVQSTNLI